MTEPEQRKPQRGRLRGPDRATKETLLRLSGVSVLAGLLTAALILPWVGSIGLVGRDTAAAFMAMPYELEVPRLAERIVLTDGADEPFGEVAHREREIVDLDEMSPWVPAALMAIEDDRFYEHGGLDLRGLLRAALRTAQGDVQGGSSLTQQYVKNLLIENADTQEEIDRASAPTLHRKVVELRYAIDLEERMTKDEILQGYLNLAYFGSGAHGIEVAAKRYFSTSASELDPGQAALLAGLVRGPSYYDPLTNPEAALERRNLVLDRMADTGHLDRAKAEEHKSEGLDIDHTPRAGSCAETEFPFYCDYVMRRLADSDVLGDTAEEREESIERGGLTVRTGMSRTAQEAAQEAVEKYVPPEETTKFAAQAIVAPGSGRVRALAQNLRHGFDAEEPGTTSLNLSVDRAAGGTTGFQAGSTFKVYALAAALDSGLDYGTSFNSPKETSVSGMRNCEGGTMSSWSVRNAGESDGGSHNMLSATRGSVNTYFAQLQRRVGLCETAQMAESTGIHRADGEDLGVWSSFVLGDQEVSPLTVASSYAVFASRGTYCEPNPIAAILTGPPDHEDTEEIRVGSDCDENAVDTHVADGVNHLLQQPFKGGTANGLDIGSPAAGKTGTTDGAAYAWFAGYTPHLASAVAVGDIRGGEENPLQNVTIGDRHYGIVYGGTLPGPIWQETMEAAVEVTPQDGFASSPKQFGDPRAKPDDDDS